MYLQEGETNQFPKLYKKVCRIQLKHQIGETSMSIQKLANPAPLGLLGFGLTTVLLNLHNAGVFNPLDTMILAMGIAFGGLAQIIVGIMEYKKGNTFGTVAFSAYGFFWWSLVLLLVLPKLTFISPGFAAPNRRIDGSILLHVGHIHLRNVLWHPKSKPRTTIRIHELGNTILHANNTRTTWQPSLVQHNHRYRRRHMRRKRSLPWTRRSLKRSKPENSPANIPSQTIKIFHFPFLFFLISQSFLFSYSRKLLFLFKQKGLFFFCFNGFS